MKPLKTGMRWKRNPHKTAPTNELLETFRTAMRTAGLEYSGPILADGTLHRFKAAGDKERNSWFVLHSQPPAAGAFGCWKRGLKENFYERNGSLSQSQWNSVRRRWQEAERERELAETERHAKARKVGAWIVSRSKPVRSHPYLDSKGVHLPGEVREYRGALLVPLIDADGTLHSLQFIGPGGAKRFFTGGRVAGCFFPLADRTDGPLVIAEGVATAASIFEATGWATVAAMHAGNLLAVAKALRAKWPNREIVVAADNDQFTPGNPGVTKATESAKAIGARRAVPQFADVTTKGTDFNDLHQLEGLNIVKDQIKAAGVPTETDEEIIARLATLPPLEYERARKTVANHMGITRLRTLDDLVDAKRPIRGDATLQGTAVDLADVSPWPEPVDGAAVLEQAARTFSRYVVLPDGAADALALWTAHAHCFEAFLCTPRLNISSPEKGCGKTTLRDVVAALIPRPLLTENLSVAVLFRLVEAHKPTILGDEYDAWLKDNEELRGLLNAGHRRGAMAYRCEGEANSVRSFRVYAPAALCGLGSLPGTLHDRSIVIRLERAKAGELPERFDSRHTDREQELCRKLARWTADNFNRLADSDPAMPSTAFNRLADNWRPLFAIAELASGDWPRRAAAAFTKLTSREDGEAQGLGAMLLADIWQMFRTSGAVRMFSKTLVESLLQMSDHPWPEAHKGRPITETWLARRLRSFGVSPRLIRAGETVGRGYELADFQDVVDRYLPIAGDSKCYGVTVPANKGENAHSEALQASNGVTLENSQNVNVYAGCNGVTLSKPGKSEKQLSEAMLL